MKHHSPVRIFVGHLSDVDCLEFHPNIHYLATGSNDKSVRLWSAETGECVRVLFTVSGAVRSLKFTRSGMHLIVGNEYGVFVVFDVNKANPLEVVQTCC
jgi:transcription initiation factor TFIID subunit 5